MLKMAQTLIVAAFACVAALSPALAEKRVALVLGNADYRNAPALKNPRNDANDMAVKLRSLGFKVIDGHDLDRSAMERRIRDFASEIVDADVALFYYAGHGIQANDTNFLAPIDASLNAEADLDFEAIPLDLIMRQMQRSARVGLVFLDACRDNPLARNLMTASRSLSIGRGLAPVERASGMMIAFATEPGAVALDGKGRNSPFTEALLKHIGTKGATVNDVMIEVRKDVMAITDNKQVPWENSSLTGRFYFKTASLSEAQSSAPATDARAPLIEVADATVEHTFWTSIQDSDNPTLYEAYLRQFPNGVYAPIAEAKLTAARSIAVEPVEPKVQPAPTPQASAPVKQASLQPASSVDAVQAPLDHHELATRLQSHLKRLGCYSAGIDGIWGRGSQAAVERFNSRANARLISEEPTQLALDIVSQHTNTVCAAPVQATRAIAPTPEPEPRAVRRPRREVVHQPRIVHEPAPVVRHGPRSGVNVHISRRFGGGGGRGRISIGIGGGGGFRL